MPRGDESKRKTLENPFCPFINVMFFGFLCFFPKKVKCFVLVPFWI